MLVWRRMTGFVFAPPVAHVRRDVQGLRAVAVSLVVLNHLLGRPRAGFLGVDVFFVISGFLITGLLDRELERTGRIDLVAFYRRRFKRLAPASFLTVLVVVLVGLVIFNTARASSTLQDGAWAILLSANWRMVELGTNYLLATDVTSPLQHFWSLSVEEQFYLVWPLLLSAAFLLPVSAVARRRVGFALIVVVLLASFTWAVYDTRVVEARAYFSTASRAWELAAGGLLYFATPMLSRLPGRLLGVVGWIGLIGLALSVKNVTDSVMPAPGALLPVLCVMAIIAGGSGGNDLRVFPLATRPLVYLGGISFSVYLWHFPVIVMLGEVLPKGSLRFDIMVLAMTAVLAVASYNLVERPLRRAKWTLRPQLGRPRLRPLVYTVGASALIVALSIASMSLREPARAQAVDLSGITSGSVASSALTVREHAVTEALSETGWPAGLQDVQSLADDRSPEWLTDGCLGEEVHSDASPVANARRCVYGDRSSKHTVMVLGDSRAISYLPGIRLALPSWRIEVWTVAQCPFVNATIRRGDGSVDLGCPRFRAAALAQAKKERPDLIVLTNQPAISAVTGSSSGSSSESVWATGTEDTVRVASEAARRVVVLDPPPEMTSVQGCRTPLKTPTQCASTIGAPYLQMVRT